MITVRISGGLGNQLFQYAFGRYLENILKCEVFFDIQTNKKSVDFTNRELGITSFNINIKLATNSQLKIVKHFKKGMINRINRKITQILPFIYKSYFVEFGMHNKIKNKFIKRNCYYDGYWQNFNYLKPIQDILQKEIKIKSNISEEFQNILNKIEMSNAISIHIRRGDYISIKKNRQKYMSCSLEYYNNAIDFFIKENSESIFYIFSDDIPWAKNNFCGSHFSFINENKAHQDLYLMSRCKSNIIANSTFSWWAAWINPNKNKIVVAPKYWYIKNNLTSELIPESWVRM